MRPVNKVPSEGIPTTYPQIIELISKEAQEKGWDFIKPNIVNSVIQRVFSEGGALLGIPHFVPNSIKGFGRWIPDKDGIRKRERYYRERKKYKAKHLRRLRANQKMIYRAKAEYKKYIAESTAEITMSYYIWKRATGKKQKIDRGYAKLNKMRKAWMKREQTFGYITMKPRTKKYKRK